MKETEITITDPKATPGECAYCGGPILSGFDDCPTCLVSVGLLLEDSSAFSPEKDEGGIESDLGVAGPYRLIRELGRGGFGTVYLALQQTPVYREVAVKILHPGMNSAEILGRFESERQALAQMNHPNIAQVYDAGETDVGQPFFVLEFANGPSITTYCQVNRLTIPERLELMEMVADAVAHAHRRGVIHRDLKPSNILVTRSESGAPIPKIIDFGVAKATLTQLGSRTFETRTGLFIGTPEYASPEQIRGVRDIDTRTDVYSLGRLLYELLIGVHPWQEPLEPTASLDRLLSRTREVPPTLSERARQLLQETACDIAKDRHLGEREWHRLLRGELEWITNKAIASDRESRYDSAQALRADIRRFLDGRAIEAAPPSMTYRFQRFVKRRKYETALALVTLILIVGFSVLGSLTKRRYTLEQTKAALFAMPIEQLGVFLNLNRENIHEIARTLEAPPGDPDREQRVCMTTAIATGDPEPLVDNFLQLDTTGWDAYPRMKAGLDVLAEQRFSTALTERLWERLADEALPTNARLRAAFPLAGQHANDPRWEELAPWLSTQLLAISNGRTLEYFSSFLEPVAAVLNPLLMQNASGTDQAVGDRAINLLILLNAQSRAGLMDLMPYVSPAQVDLLGQALASSDKDAHHRLMEWFKKDLSRLGSTPREGIKNQAAIIAGILLLKTGHWSDVLPLFEENRPSDLRKQALLAAATMEHQMPLTHLIPLLQAAQSPNALYYALLMLGASSLESLPESQRKSLIEHVSALYQTHPTATVHGAANWLLRQWAPERVDQLNEQLRAVTPATECEWRHPLVGGPMLYWADPTNTASPPLEVAFFETSVADITKAEAAGAISLPGEWEAFREQSQQPARYLPPNVVYAYCTWLTKSNGIPDSQCCYEINNGNWQPKAQWQALTGYRIPSRKEWHAIADSVRFEERLFKEDFPYVGYFELGRNARPIPLPNSYYPIGKKWPNSLGIFDLFGSLGELADRPTTDKSILPFYPLGGTYFAPYEFMIHSDQTETIPLFRLQYSHGHQLATLRLVRTVAP